MAHQLNIVLLSLGLLQGAMVSLFLFRKKHWHSSHLFLILFLVVVGLQLTFKLLSKTWLWQHLEFIYQCSYCLPFLIGPLFYLFIKFRKNTSSSTSRQALHFLPFIFSLLHTRYAFIYHDSYMPDLYWKIFPWPSLQFISLFTYATISWRLILSFEKESIVRGMKSFLFWIVSAETIIIITITLMFKYHRSFPDVRLLFIVLTAFIYWLSYRLMSQPELFMHMPEAAMISLKTDRTAKYAHSGLKPEEADRIETSLMKMMNDQKLFLQADISIEVVAHKLGVPKHHLSRVINEKFEKTYMDYVNSLRLEEVRSRLINPKFHHYSVSAIALDSGFSSVSSFNKMFKRQFQVTPSQFRAQNLKENSA